MVRKILAFALIVSLFAQCSKGRDQAEPTPPKPQPTPDGSNGSGAAVDNSNSVWGDIWKPGRFTFLESKYEAPDSLFYVEAEHIFSSGDPSARGLSLGDVLKVDSKSGWKKSRRLTSRADLLIFGNLYEGQNMITSVDLQDGEAMSQIMRRLERDYHRNVEENSEKIWSGASGVGKFFYATNQYEDLRQLHTSSYGMVKDIELRLWGVSYRDQNKRDECATIEVSQGAFSIIFDSGTDWGFSKLGNNERYVSEVDFGWYYILAVHSKEKSKEELHRLLKAATSKYEDISEEEKEVLLQAEPVFLNILTGEKARGWEAVEAFRTFDSDKTQPSVLCYSVSPSSGGIGKYPLVMRGQAKPII